MKKVSGKDLDSSRLGSPFSTSGISVNHGKLYNIVHKLNKQLIFVRKIYKISEYSKQQA